MPRTESGPAICNRSREWNPDDGHSPITKRDRLDARFLNSISKPPRKGKQTVGPPSDPELSKILSNLKPGESAFDRGEPVFERGRGALLSATWEGASCGTDASAEIIARRGPSYEHQIRKARRPLNLVAATIPGAPPGLSRFFVEAVVDHKSKYFRPHKVEHDDGTTTIEHVLFVRHNGRKLRHIGFRNWFGEDYPWRWDQAASCYLDIRIDGKATNSADPTMSQAAARIADEASDNLSTRAYSRHEGRSCPIIFYEKPSLGFSLLWIMAGLDAPLRDFWFFAAEQSSQEEKPLYPQKLKLAATRHKRPAPPTARDDAIEKYRPLAKYVCRRLPLAYREDAIQACMERLVKVYDNNWDPSRGPFDALVGQAIEWGLQDFKKERRGEALVERSINLNDPANNTNDDDDDDKPPTPEQPDKMNLSSLEKQAATAKRRLIAERLGCLNLRERRVIEARLALNGYKDPVRHKALAAQLGVDERQIRRIERAAVQKLQQAVA
jgi:RNA polymerase sigma factor (sigma-70 family)